MHIHSLSNRPLNFSRQYLIFPMIPSVIIIIIEDCFFCFHHCLWVICFFQYKAQLVLSICSNSVESKYNESYNISDLFNSAALNMGYDSTMWLQGLVLQLRVVKPWISEFLPWVGRATRKIIHSGWGGGGSYCWSF